MRVAHIFWSLTFGGIETMLVNIINEQSKLGLNVSLIIVNNMYDTELLEKISREVDVYKINRELHSFNPLFIYKLNKILFRLNPDAIHLHNSTFYSVINKKFRDRICCTLHALPYGRLRRTIVGKYIPFFNFNLGGNVANLDIIPKVVSISDAVKSMLEQKYGVNSIVINNGIFTNEFLERNCEDIKESVLRIVCVGRLDHEVKGQDILIKAVAFLRGRAVVDFIGTGKSLNYLKQLTSSLKADNWVTFLNKRPQSYIRTQLKNYDLFVLPSRLEGFGLTVAEAMAASVPVLVSAGQGPAEVTCDDKYGWTFKNGDIDDLVQKIKYIINNYPKALTKLPYAKQHVVMNYDISVTVKEYLDLYKRT